MIIFKKINNAESEKRVKNVFVALVIKKWCRK